MDGGAEEKLLAQSLLSASRRRDIIAIRDLLKKVSANVQDATTGSTPLHAVVQGTEVGVPAAEDVKTKDGTEEPILEIVKLLLENGAIWNDLDKNGETPGCLAWRRGLRKVYQIIVEAGVRAELLLNKLEEIDSEDNEASEVVEEPDSTSGMAANAGSTSAPSKGTAESTEPDEDYIDHWDSNADFLRSSLRYTDTQLLDSSSNAVMMDWETEIMSRHAELLLPTTGLRVMNIGHGMGIVDSAIQTHKPKEHHIVEAHPGVLQQMRKNGWYDKPEVTVHEGRWQDVLPKLMNEGIEWDAIYYDTFAEEYKDLKELFTEHVIGLMDQAGRFGFYNGLGADRRISYDVYTNVVEIDLLEAGLKTEWEEIQVPSIDWKGVRRSYWNVDVYRLPTCQFA